MRASSRAISATKPPIRPVRCSIRACPSTYEAELLLWLTQRYGYAGDAAEARAYFAALPAEQQRAFARQVYFAELRNSGREYNGKLAAREGSYLRGRQAIAALFPDHDAQGAPCVMTAASRSTAARACRPAPAGTSRR